MTSKPFFLKPRGAVEPVPWEEIAVDAPDVKPDTRLDLAQFVALDVESTGNSPFLVLEIGAERFRLDGPLSFFDTLVDCQAPINPYAHRRHHIDRSMLIGAPEFRDARRAFLRFAQGAVLVEHSHDAFAGARRDSGACSARRCTRHRDGVPRADRSSSGNAGVDHGG